MIQLDQNMREVRELLTRVCRAEFHMTDTQHYLVVGIVQGFSIQETLVLREERAIPFPKLRAEASAPRHLRREKAEPERERTEVGKNANAKYCEKICDDSIPDVE